MIKFVMELGLILTFNRKMVMIVACIGRKLLELQIGSQIAWTTLSAHGLHVARAWS